MLEFQVRHCRFLLNWWINVLVYVGFVRPLARLHSCMPGGSAHADLVVAKLFAGREKDRDFAIALIQAKLVDHAKLHERADVLDEPGAVIKRVHTTITRCSSRARG